MQEEGKVEKLTLRVYGIVLNEKEEVLVSDELLKGGDFTKFPGGGLELGEGTRDCLIREFMEETETPVEVLNHIYTTDELILSRFRPCQVICVYYKVRLLTAFQKPIKKKAFDYDKGIDGLQSFRWVPLEEFDVNKILSFRSDVRAMETFIAQRKSAI